jgi:hypothetical protein
LELSYTIEVIAKISRKFFLLFDPELGTQGKLAQDKLTLPENL